MENFKVPNGVVISIVIRVKVTLSSNHMFYNVIHGTIIVKSTYVIYKS
jgi:hypothetical protein